MIPEYTKEEVDKRLADAEYKFAKTMADIPHSYTLLHKHWSNSKRTLEIWEILQLLLC